MKKGQALPRAIPNPAPVPAGWPKPLGPEPFYGLVGEVVKAIERYTEADPVALLVVLLAMFGNMVGPGQYLSIGNVRHALNLFIALIGATAKSRKDTAEREIESLVSEVDPVWALDRVQDGLSSAEGVIYAVRDAIEDEPGVADKRLTVVESEFAAVLKNMARTGNLISTKLRALWDGRKRMRVLTRRFPLVATGALVSIITATTLDDLKRYLNLTDLFNGFANRFVFVLVRRHKLIPNPRRMPLTERRELVARLKEATDLARKVKRIQLTLRAQKLWEKRYPELTADVPGMLGAATSRSEVQVLRMAAIYALLDSSDCIKTQHLKAALELWRYCLDSARFIFGGRSTQTFQKQLLNALQSAPRGLTLTEISRTFNHHRSKAEISEALNNLQVEGLVTSKEIPTDGRPAFRWTAISARKGKKNRTSNREEK